MGLILHAVKEDDFDAVRKSVDRFLERHGEDYLFMLAFDAALMFAEGRHESGHGRFKECQTLMPNDNSPDTRYVHLFCHFNLNLQTDSEWRKARQDALLLNPDPLVKAFLSFPAEERMSEIIRKAGRPVVFVDAEIDF